MQEILMTPDMGMRFLVWSFYYHDIQPQKNKSFATYGKFNQEDVLKLDQLKEALFKCFEESSVANACQQFQNAKVLHEPCPFSQEELDLLFAKEI